MIHFQRQALRSLQSIGEILLRTRESYGLSREEIAETLCIQKKNLEYLEDNAFFRIPEALYRELFLKAYSTYLGLPWEQMRAQYHRECGLYSVAPPDAERRKRVRGIRTSSLWIASNMIRNAFLTLCVGGGFLYVAFIGWYALTPPQLVIFQPQEAFSTSSVEQIVVSGKTRKEARVSINGQLVVKKHDGTFSQEVVLQQGLNDITIAVSKKFSRPQSMTRTVLFIQDQKYSYKK